LGVCRWAVALVLVAVTACGQPEHRYVTNKAEGVYLKVPRHWHQVDPLELDAPLGDPFSLDAWVQRQLTWRVAFDAAEQPTLDHLSGSDSSEPMLMLQVVNLAQVDVPPLADNKSLKNIKELRANLSLDVLRNRFLPITADKRAEIAASGDPRGAQLVESFELLLDEEITPAKELYGVRSVYNYRLGIELETFDLTALADNKHSRLYILLVRCTARCYAERHDELDKIVRSFTVRGEK